MRMRRVSAYTNTRKLNLFPSRSLGTRCLMLPRFVVHARCARAQRVDEVCERVHVSSSLRRKDVARRRRLKESIKFARKRFTVRFMLEARVLCIWGGVDA